MSNVQRDQWGRPMVPDPSTGSVRAWTRSTTLASTISDRRALEQWSQRNVIRGMAANESLLVQAAAAGDDREELTRIVNAALDAAQSSSAADIGTAVHKLLERIDLGEDVVIPESYQPDIDAYQQALRLADVAIIPGWVERFVLTPEVEAAGTPDRLVSVEGHKHPLIGDLKTGRGVIRYGLLEAAAQLAIYAHATHWFDGESLHEMPKVDQDWALLIHLPAGEGKCDLYLLDIEAGWEIAQLCYRARDWRKKAKGLALSYDSEVNRRATQDDPLMWDIERAHTSAALKTIWLFNRDSWTDEHTEAAKARKAELEGAAA